ncbi:MAG TPA: LuxR C-terminal-related transcriptional regulator [Jatrophihabitans sp.]
MAVTISMQKFERAVRLVSDLAELGDPEEFADVASAGLAEIVGCDLVTYNELGTHPAGVSYRDWPRHALDSSTQPLFASLVDQHPLVSYYRRTGDGKPMMISDFVDRRQFHRMPIYTEFFRQIPVEHQIAVTLSTRDASTVVGLALNRARGEFDDTDRAILAVLRAPLICALTKARIRHAIVMRGAAAVASDRSLTDRERSVLALVALGLTNVAIGHSLSVSPRTVAKHLEHIYRKLDVTSRAAAVARFGAAEAEQRLD